MNGKKRTERHLREDQHAQGPEVRERYICQEYIWQEIKLGALPRLLQQLPCVLFFIVLSHPRSTSNPAAIVLSLKSQSNYIITLLKIFQYFVVHGGRTKGPHKGLKRPTCSSSGLSLWTLLHLPPNNLPTHLSKTLWPPSCS